jgi:hypothetical protein
MLCVWESMLRLGSSALKLAVYTRDGMLSCDCSLVGGCLSSQLTILIPSLVHSTPQPTPHMCSPFRLQTGWPDCMC